MFVECADFIQNIVNTSIWQNPDSYGRGPGFDTRSGNTLSFLLPLFQEGQLSVTGESMCTKYWLPARRSKPAQESVVRLTDRPDMTLDVYQGRKTTIQQLFGRNLVLTIH